MKELGCVPKPSISQPALSSTSALCCCGLLFLIVVLLLLFFVLLLFFFVSYSYFCYYPGVAISEVRYLGWTNNGGHYSEQ